MKKLMIILGVALFTVAGCEEKQQQEEKNAAQVVMHKQHFEDGTETPINGEREYFKDGNLHKKVIFIDGYPETIISYYSDQQKRTKMVVADTGKGEVVEHVVWYKNGQKKFESANEVIREWYENGQLKTEAHYDSGNVLHGLTKVWYEDGTLKGKENYVQGELDGERIKWDEDGNLDSEEEYKEGELVES